jgi:hypothetical protein
MIVDLDVNNLAEELYAIEARIREEPPPDLISWHEWAQIQATAADIFYEVQRRLREAQPKIEAELAARRGKP